MSERGSTLADQRRLKSGWRSDVRAMSGIEATADVTRVSATSVARYYDKALPDYVPVDILADVLIVGEGIATLNILADLAGYDLVKRLPAGAKPITAETLGIIAKETGEAMAALGADLADGKITAEEAANSLPECEDALRAWASVVHFLHRRRGEG